jgi:hypothetical protein
MKIAIAKSCRFSILPTPDIERLSFACPGSTPALDVAQKEKAQVKAAVLLIVDQMRPPIRDLGFFVW